MPNNNGWGLIPWGTGGWGLPVHPIIIPPSPSHIKVIDVNPAPGSFNISRNQTFTFTIKTDLFDLNPNSVFIFLDNKIVVNGAFTSSEFAVIKTTNIDGKSYDYSITPNYLFRDRDVFTLQVYATDINGNPSFPFWAGYLVIDTRPPLLTPIYPLDGYIDVPLDLTIHFIVNQLAAPDAGLDATTMNVVIDDTPAMINGVIQPAFDGTFAAFNIPAPNDITTPFEILLDYDNRYSPNEIVTVSALVQSTTIPVVDSNSLFLNQLGQSALDANGAVLPSFSTTNITKINNQSYQVTLDFAANPNLILDGYIADGYQLQNFNENTFFILNVIDGYNVLVETLPKTLRGKYSFVTTQFDTAPPTPVFAGYFQGIYLVDDLGDGKHINVTWHTARTTRPDNDLAYLIYYSTTRMNVFMEEPKLITQGRKLKRPELTDGIDPQLFGFFAEIPLPAGTTYYFGVRATEFPHTTTPLIPPDGYGSSAAGLVVVDGYSFQIPNPQMLLISSIGSGAITIKVANTTGFSKLGGYILVGGEIMKYSSLTINTFTIPSNGRGLFGSQIAQTHNVGEIVRMYYGNFDDNSVIAKGLVSWEPPFDPHRTRPDLITTDFTLEDGVHMGFEFFDYCGYHRQRPDDLLNDQTCGTYVGGEFNGHRGLFIYDRMLANEEQLLETTGEPAILLRRIWGGEACLCRTSRKDSSRVRSCAICFGTGFKKGFVQFFNPRRDDQRIMVHFAAADEEVAMKPQAAWDQTFSPNTWTLAVPSIKDRDCLVRFDEFGQMQWIYIVDTVSRGKTFFGRATRQRLKLSRLDKSDIMYQFKFIK